MNDEKPTMSPAGGQPEALATFAATARNDGRKPDSIGLHATPETEALPADSALKDEAATRLLRKGLSGEDEGAQAALEALPDRMDERSHRPSPAAHGLAAAGPGRGSDKTGD